MSSAVSSGAAFFQNLSIRPALNPCITYDWEVLLFNEARCLRRSSISTCFLVILRLAASPKRLGFCYFRLFEEELKLICARDMALLKRYFLTSEAIPGVLLLRCFSLLENSLLELSLAFCDDFDRCDPSFLLPLLWLSLSVSCITSIGFILNMLRLFLKSTASVSDAERVRIL